MIDRSWSRAGILGLVLGGWLLMDGTAAVWAQDGREDRVSEGEPRDRGREGGGRGLLRRFDEASPERGQPLPDIEAYDADGKSIRLRSALEGHYSVIVFGCLT